MNCCDYDCTEGRDCPARGMAMCRLPPHGSTPPPVTWRGWLVDAALAVALVLVIVAAVAAALNL